MQNILKIELRHKQLYEDGDITKPIVVVCNNDGTSTYAPGLVPESAWHDFTQDTNGLEKFKLSWTAVAESYGEGDSVDNNTSGSNYDKGLSAELSFYGDAFYFIFNWLMAEPCQMLNCVEAKITDMNCGKEYRIFEIKLDNTKYSPEERCIVSMPLREKDDAWHVFQKTIIEDDWQKWFNKDGTSTKEHPTFAYVVEKKPKLFLAIYVVLIYLVGVLGAAAMQVPPVMLAFQEWVRRTLSVYYYCPSPFIRTYIENICAKYGFTFNTMFDDVPANDYRDTCLFWPVSAHYKNFSSGLSPSAHFLWENRTVLSFSRFLNQLKKVFNAEWYITPNKQLVFQPKAFFDAQPPLHDFTAPGADRIYKLTYQYNGNKKPAYGDYQYSIDPQDTCSNEIKWRYNAIVDFDGPANNPMLEGHITKNFDFAMTAFHNDGTSKDYLEDGIRTGRTIAILILLVGLGELFLSANPLTVAIVAALLAAGYLQCNDYLNNFFDSAALNGCVRTSSSEINMPRLLIYDRNSQIRTARTISVTAPLINPQYNTAPIDYYGEHPSNDQSGTFGTDVMKVYNYPMYVEELFLNNLYDRFHEVDNPLRNAQINQTFEGVVDLCCEWLDKLGVWDGDYIKIGAVVILENRDGRLIKGRITDIGPDYDKGEILIKGNVLK